MDVADMADHRNGPGTPGQADIARNLLRTSDGRVTVWFTLIGAMHII
jgi:hypothetical protein